MRHVLKLLVFLGLILATGLRAADESGPTVPPKGTEPFDPKPLMDKLSERITKDKFRFVVLGDTKHATTFPKLVKFLDEKTNPDFVLTTGDMVAAGGGKRGAELWEKLSIDNGADFRKRPWWPAIGNHEIAGDIIVSSLPNDAQDELLRKNWKTGIENFKSFYNLPREYYSFTFRNAIFIALPFPEPKDESEQWLRDELKKSAGQGKHIFVFNHMPFYTVGQKSKDEVRNEPTWITKLMTEYKVTAAFSGHDHGYYRTIRDKVPYIISAGGGAGLYSATRTDEALPDDVYYYSGTYHNGVTKKDRIMGAQQQFFVVVDVDGSSVQASCTTATGEILDELTLSK